jgi:hypothetical protein
MSVRVAKYQFRTNGTVTQEFWSWRQNSISGKDQGYWTKPSSGYRTNGCLRDCPIRTPYGFQSGANGATASGRFSVSGTVLTIRWDAGWTERWRVDASRPGVSALTLISSDPSARGWGLGSNQGLARGVTASQMYDAGYLRGPHAENDYGVATRFGTVGFNPPDYTKCSNGLCLQGKNVAAADKRTWYSTYYAVNPATDGRKVFNNFQTGAVQQIEAPGSDCISAGGGHTVAALQALDDSGRLIGIVGVEASLSQRSYGQAIVSSFAMAAWKYQNPTTNSTPLLK